MVCLPGLMICLIICSFWIFESDSVSGQLHEQDETAPTVGSHEILNQNRFSECMVLVWVNIKQMSTLQCSLVDLPTRFWGFKVMAFLGLTTRTSSILGPK